MVFTGTIIDIHLKHHLILYAVSSSFPFLLMVNGKNHYKIWGINKFTKCFFSLSLRLTNLFLNSAFVRFFNSKINFFLLL